MSAGRASNETTLKEAGPSYHVAVPDLDGIDTSLLEDSLAKTPWERMLANDDALNFGESLRAAMERRNAKS